MIINFKSGSSGWANYTVVGTPEKKRDNKINKIVGDPYFTEKIANQNKFSGEYYKMLVAPGVADITNKKMYEILEETIKNVFVGLKEDEYTYSAVLHRDSKYPHWHIITPKQNLLTGQHLQLYMQGIDTKRIQALQDTIAIKHGLKTMEEIKPIVRKQKKATYEKNSKEPIHFDFQDKKSKALAQQQVTELVKDNIQSINSTADIKALVEARTDLKVVKIDGFDYKKDFHYITTQDMKGRKTAIRGELFNPDFFKQPKQDQVQELELNHKTYNEVEKEQIAKKIKADLRRENEKRYAVVQKHGTKIKAQKRAELQELQNKIQKEKDENPRRTTTPSPRREQRPTAERRRQQSPTSAERAIQIEAKRKRAIEAIRQARERVLEELESNAEDIRAKYEQQHSNFASELFGVIRTAIGTTKELISRLFRVEEKATTISTTEMKQNKEKIKPQEAQQSPNEVEESHSTVESQESPMSDEEFQENWGEFMTDVNKELKRSSPKLGQ